MPNRKTLTVSITSEQDVFVRAHLASGQYASASEVIRAALRAFEREETASAELVKTKPRQQVRAPQVQ